MTRSVQREVVTAPEVDTGRSEDDPVGEWLGLLVTDPAHSPEEVISAGRALDAIEAALGGLNDDQRRWLHQYMEGCSLREIAADEGIALGTLRVRFDKATRILRGRTPHLRQLLRGGEAS